MYLLQYSVLGAGWAGWAGWLAATGWPAATTGWLAATGWLPLAGWLRLVAGRVVRAAGRAAALAWPACGRPRRMGSAASLASGSHKSGGGAAAAPPQSQQQRLALSRVLTQFQIERATPHQRALHERESAPVYNASVFLAA